MSRHPSDMRIGVNGMCEQVRRVGLDLTNRDVYIFVGKSRKIMKLLHWERAATAIIAKTGVDMKMFATADALVG